MCYFNSGDWQYTYLNSDFSLEKKIYKCTRPQEKNGNDSILQ